MASYRTLTCWQATHQVVLRIAKLTNQLPSRERFALTSQLWRAAISAAANLAEGSARFGAVEFRRHARIAAGSLAEVDYLLFLARELSYLDERTYKDVLGELKQATYLVNRLARALDRP